MKKNMLSILAVAMLAGVGMQAAHADDKADYEIGLGYGSNGVQLTGAYYVNDYVSVRGAYSTGYSVNQTTTSDGNVYNGNLNLQGNQIGLALHPFKGDFYVMGGYYQSNSTIEANATGDVSWTASGTTFTASGVNVKAKANISSGPMVAMGVAGGRSKGLSYTAQLALVSTSVNVDSLTESTGTATAEQINAQKAIIQKDLANISVIPVVSAGITYSF
jgi:hypothetical protein